MSCVDDGWPQAVATVGASVAQEARRQAELVQGALQHDETLKGASGTCAETFSSRRTLRLQKLFGHGFRKDVRHIYISSVCPTCELDWYSRVRCLLHGERETQPCQDAWRGGNIPRVAEKQVAQVDEEDRLHRRERRRLGLAELCRVLRPATCLHRQYHPGQK